MRVAAALAVALACALAAPPAVAQPRSTEVRIPMRFRNTNLPEILERVAPQLGERFIYDSSLSGRVTIALTRPVAPAEAWELLHVALALRGFALAPIPAGGYKIVPLSQTSASDPWSVRLPATPGEARVVTLLDLEQTSADELREVIAPLLDAQTLAIALPSSNVLVVGTTERNLAGIARLVHALDVETRSPLRVRMLREREAAFVLDALDLRYGEASGIVQPVELWADDRTNAILYRAPSALGAEIEATIVELDRRALGGGELAVLRLAHADPAELVERLQSLSAAPGGVGPNAGMGLAGARLNVVADPATASIVVNASPDVIERVRETVAALDRAPRQIAVEVLVQEWMYDDDLDFRSAARVPFDTGPGANSFGEATIGAAGFPGELATDDLQIDVVRGLNRVNVVANANDVVARTLLQPHLIAMAGEEQLLFNGDNVPVPVASAEQPTTGDLLRQRTTIERRDTGIELRVRPTIGREHHVELELDIDIEAVASALVSTSQGPTFTQRQLNTVAQLRPGAALVVATPVQRVRSTQRLGVPFLMDLPVVGPLFANTVVRDRRLRLLIAVQTQPLPSPEALVAYTIRRRIAFERAAVRDAELGFDRSVPGAYALRVATERDARAADALAARIDTELHPARVLAWTSDDERHFDVHLLGFARYEDAADEAFRLYVEGLVAEIVPVADGRGTLGAVAAEGDARAR